MQPTNMHITYFSVVISLTLSLSAPLFAATQANTFIDNGNGSVTDTATGLSWQQQNVNIAVTHANAVTYCQGLTLSGESDWRLPNVKELMTIVDYRVHNPSIDDAMFPNTNSSSFWSASSRASGSASAWVVVFSVGFVDVDSKTSSNYVRCVRSGQ